MLYNSIFFLFQILAAFLIVKVKKCLLYALLPSPEMFKIVVCGLQISDCMPQNERETQSMKINRKQVDEYLLRVVGRQMAMTCCQKTNLTKRP